MLEQKFIESMFRFFFASETTLHKLMEKTKPEELTTIHYKILEYLYFNSSTDISGLANCLYLSLPNTSREIKKLIAANYVMKSVDIHDKRRYFLHLSKKGRLLMDQIFEKVIANATSIYSHLDSTKQLELVSHMDKVIEGFLIAEKE